MSPHLSRGPANGPDNVDVSGASAKISFQGMGDFFVAGIGIRFEQVNRGHYHAWSAVAALQAVLLLECLLHWVKGAAVGEALDGRDLGAVRLHGENRTGFHGDAVDMNRASATLARVAAYVGARQAQVFAEKVDE